VSSVKTLAKTDVTRPSLRPPSRGEDVPTTLWVADRGARCIFKDFQPVAIALADQGAVWVANHDEIVVFTPPSCDFKPIPAGYERRGNPVTGLVSGPDATMYASLRKGQLISIDPQSLAVVEILGAMEDPGEGSSTVGLARFPDGSTALVRMETDGPVLYRIDSSGKAGAIKRFGDAVDVLGLSTIPGVGVSIVQYSQSGRSGRIASEITDGVFGTDGTERPSEFTETTGLACVAYSSPTSRWVQYQEELFLDVAGTKLRRFASEGGCSTAALNSDGTRLWYAAHFWGGALYEVDISSVR
jgi:hypothetical protein